MRVKNIISWSVLAGLVATLYLGISNFQNISDWLKLRDYHPDGVIVRLADETTMKSPTRKVFYVNHPDVEGKVEFRSHCETSEKTIVLGCYIQNKGIYLLDVKDVRLNGVLEVTAAHETLHAMYDRLSDSERARVDKMTEEYFSGLKDERIRKTIDSYRSRDPSVVPNELHSILGTEVKNLSPELESYYSRYFKNREQIVTYSNQYEQAFIDIENKASDYDARLSDLKQKIDANEKEIGIEGNQIDSEKQKLDSLLAAKNIKGYNAEVPIYNRLVDNYNQLVNETKQLINEYNALGSEKNQLVVQQQELFQAIDSNSINEK